MIDKCLTCGSTDNDGWLLETVIDYETNTVTSEEVPCPACAAAVVPEPAMPPAIERVRVPTF